MRVSIARHGEAMIATIEREDDMQAAAAPAANRIYPGPAIGRTRPVVIALNRAHVACSACALHELCLGDGLDANALSEIDELVANRVRLRKADTLFRAGDRFMSLYAIRSGSCKTISLAGDGHDQVAGYHMAGEIIGVDGIGTDRHECQAVALEDTEVCVLPFHRLEAYARKNMRFQHNVHRLLSREIARQAKVMLVLGTMLAERRLAVFLLDLGDRYHARGYSSCEFVLRMTREEIGSYLGLKLETVSRLFSRFQREGLVQVQGRVVKVLDRSSLRRLIESSE
jgi:CRP/FNR family transcriptional regulator, anaerobic regulatory protein